MNTSFGETLRNAREAKGLTTSQIAAKTRMLVQIVEEMENEDFHRIAAPIYGRGFVKLYAEYILSHTLSQKCHSIFNSDNHSDQKHTLFRQEPHCLFLRQNRSRYPSRRQPSRNRPNRSRFPLLSRSLRRLSVD